MSIKENVFAIQCNCLLAVVPTMICDDFSSTALQNKITPILQTCSRLVEAVNGDVSTLGLCHELL